VDASSGGSAEIRKSSPLFGGPGINQPSPVVDLMATTADVSAAFHQLSPVTTSGLAANGSTFDPSSFLSAPMKNWVAIPSHALTIACQWR